MNEITCAFQYIRSEAISQDQKYIIPEQKTHKGL